MDLVDVPVLVSVGAVCSVMTELNSKERFAVLVGLPPLLLSLKSSLVLSKLLIVVSKPTVLSVATSSELSHIFTELSFILRGLGLCFVTVRGAISLF